MNDELMKQVITKHLVYKPSTESGHYFSSFTAALRDARSSTGRDVDHGNIINPLSTGSWLGALGYMALLDQIGTCFRPKTASVYIKINSINKALLYFSSLQPAEKDAIYALRCAFAHDYSLSNTNENKPSLTHCFRVTQGTGLLIRFPASSWDGDYNNINRGTETQIDLEEFCNLVEDICTKLLELNENNQLSLELEHGVDELIHRYGFSVE